MTQYLIRRIILMVPTLVGVSLLVIGMMRLLPGDAVDILVTENAVAGGNAAFVDLINAELADEGINPDEATFQQRNDTEIRLIDERLEEKNIDPATATAAQRRDAKNDLSLNAFKDGIRAKLGLDKGYFEQWWSWTSNALQGDLGKSVKGSVSVGDELQRRLPVSFQLGIFAMIFGALVAIPVGVISAVRQDSWLDYGSRSIAIAMLALPSFFIATLHIALGSSWFGYSPPVYYKDLWDSPSINLQMVIPPAIILGCALSGTLMRLNRTQMLEVLRQDYRRTSRSKGVRERVVVIQHAVRNALLPVVTIIGLQVPVLIGGSLVLETIYSIPGIAQYLFIAIKDQDYPIIIAVNMLVALIIVVTNLLVDVTYAWLDPRVKLS
jgi:peptide/nickel transport system permease protein